MVSYGYVRACELQGARIGRFEEMATRYRELLSYMDKVCLCQLFCG